MSVLLMAQAECYCLFTLSGRILDQSSPSMLYTSQLLVSTSSLHQPPITIGCLSDFNDDDYDDDDD